MKNKQVESSKTTCEKYILIICYLLVIFRILIKLLYEADFLIYRNLIYLKKKLNLSLSTKAILKGKRKNFFKNLNSISV